MYIDNEKMVEKITNWLFNKMREKKIPLWKCADETGIGLESLKYAKKNNKMTIIQMVKVCELLGYTVKEVIEEIEQ